MGSFKRFLTEMPIIDIPELYLNFDAAVEHSNKGSEYFYWASDYTLRVKNTSMIPVPYQGKFYIYKEKTLHPVSNEYELKLVIQMKRAIVSHAHRKDPPSENVSFLDYDIEGIQNFTKQQIEDILNKLEPITVKVENFDEKKDKIVIDLVRKSLGVEPKYESERYNSFDYQQFETR